MQVGLLRQKLDSLEKCNLVMTQNYEGQLQTLKAQVREPVKGNVTYFDTCFDP